MIIDSGVVTGSLQVSGSLTVKGNLTVDGNINGTITGSVTSASYATFAQNASTASLATTNLFTASVSNNVITFTEGDGTTFNLTVATGSSTVTSSLALTNLYTASVSNNIITFTEGDGTTFNLTVATGSSTISASYAVSSSQAANATLFNSLSSSQFPQLVANNTFIGNNVFGNVTASNAQITSASVLYLNVQYETASIIYSSGSNQFGDASDDVQTLYGTVDIKAGPLTITGSVISTAGFYGALTGNADTVTTNANLTGNVTSVGNATTIAAGVVTDAMLAGSISNAKLTNSTISGKALGTNLDTLTIGTGLSGTSYNGSAAITIANTGVTANVASTGISVSGASGSVTITNTGVTSVTASAGISVSGTTGAVTIGNTGVTSAVAGTGVGVSGATGAVTFSIGQAVATSSNVQFNSLGVGTAGSAVAGEIRATADVTAFYSSDERLKEDIAPIENPIEKLMSINGVTFNWKEGFETLHSHVGSDTGVVAQQIEAIQLPGVVTTRETGYMAVNYEKLNALLIEGFKAHEKEINELKELVKTLLNK